MDRQVDGWMDGLKERGRIDLKISSLHWPKGRDCKCD